MLKKINFQISGLHCASCKTLIETEVDVLKGVKDIEVDLKTGQTALEYDDADIKLSKVFSTIEKLNYKVERSQIKKADNRTETIVVKKESGNKFIIALGLLFIFGVGYLLINRFGLFQILAKLNETNVGYGLIFLIGILASFHCVGMCGGLVVTYTAAHKANKHKNNETVPHWQYNLGRVISYTIIGGILGGFGSFFGINPVFTGIITVLAGGFMILMGLSLATNFYWFKKIQLKTPSFIARFLYNQKHSEKPKGPFVIGLLTGFMPCGPLQAMQLYALASGSVSRGALSMAVYALGTVPVMYGFGSFVSLISQDRIKQVMKFSGAIVVILGLFMFNRGLLNFGYGYQGFASAGSISKNEYVISGDLTEYQTVNMDLTYAGYSPNVLYIKKGVPVRWVINVKQMSGCTNAIILHGYNIEKKLQYGENIIEFIPEKTGEIKFSCWMQMVWGKFIVTDSDVNPNQNKLKVESDTLPVGQGCGGGNGGGCSAGGGCGCSRIIPQ